MAGGAAAGEGGGEGDLLPRRAWKQYLLQLQLHPLRTKMITAGCLAGVSDSVAQKLSGYQKIEKRRLLLKMMLGFAYGGPFGHFMHKLLDYIFKGKKDTKTVAKKVLLEQITSSPWNNLLFLFYYGYVVKKRPFKEVKTRVRKQYPSVQLSAWMFWPIIGWINHQYVPLQFQGDISQPPRQGGVFEAVIEVFRSKISAQLGHGSNKDAELDIVYCWQFNVFKWFEDLEYFSSISVVHLHRYSLTPKPIR